MCLPFLPPGVSLHTEDVGLKDITEKQTGKKGVNPLLSLQPSAPSEQEQCSEERRKRGFHQRSPLGVLPAPEQCMPAGSAPYGMRDPSGKGT